MSGCEIWPDVGVRRATRSSALQSLNKRPPAKQQIYKLLQSSGSRNLEVRRLQSTSKAS